MSTYTAVTAPTQFVESNGVMLRVIKIDEVSTVGSPRAQVPLTSEAGYEQPDRRRPPSPADETENHELRPRVLHKRLWMSGLATLKYIPRSFRVKQVGGNRYMSYSASSKAVAVERLAQKVMPA
jgi:hypothetical protein